MACKQFKKSLKIPKGQSESVYQRIDLPKEKVQKTNNDLQNKGNNKITELRTILQRESQNSRSI